MERLLLPPPSRGRAGVEGRLAMTHPNYILL